VKARSARSKSSTAAAAAFEIEDAVLLETVAAPAALRSTMRAWSTDWSSSSASGASSICAAHAKMLLPKRRRGKFPLIGINLPAHEISGGFYDWPDLPDGRIAFVIGDISGKGLDAAFLMVRVASLLRWSGKDGLAPAQWLARANNESCQTLNEGRFVCALVGQYDRSDGSVVFASAGFPPALLQSAKRFESFIADGPPLGILPDIDYGERRLTLGDDALYFFSDGAIDAREAGQQRIGSEGVRDMIARHTGLAPEPRLRALIGDLKRTQLADDTTVLLLQEPRGAAAQILLDLPFPARAEELRVVRARLREVLDTQRQS
jgi:sigma-B regulation protein RsbU (phosphoserine phosphatase)